MVSVTWKTEKQRYGHLERMIHGRMPMGTASYNLGQTKPHDPEKEYMWMLNLPGLPRAGHSPTMEAAKAAAEAAFVDWLKQAGLSPTQSTG